jgi:hypothetical protein
VSNWRSRRHRSERSWAAGRRRSQPRVAVCATVRPSARGRSASSQRSEVLVNERWLWLAALAWLAVGCADGDGTMMSTPPPPPGMCPSGMERCGGAATRRTAGGGEWVRVRRAVRERRLWRDGVPSGAAQLLGDLCGRAVQPGALRVVRERLSGGAVLLRWPVYGRWVSAGAGELRGDLREPAVGSRQLRDVRHGL